MEGIPIGIAVAPMNDFDAPFVPGPATCQGKCGGMNQAAHCGCDEACKDWNDCCFDVDLHCQGCNSETCKGNNRVCEMLPNGTFGCGCTWGLVYGGPAGCLDVDECALGLNNCIEGSTCMNQQGNFWCQCPKTMIWDSFGSCLCPKGFVGDLASGCTDIDECANGNGPCKDSATCVNHDGYYSCECEAPFYQDGMDGCQCPEGREFDGIGECVDIDECADGTGPCKDGSTCVNYDGYHECVCQAPFQSDGFDGCECPWGYAPDEVEGCVEIDECAVEPCGDSALCVDQVGYFECICEWPMESDGMLGCYCVWGYTPDGAGSCVEIDECAAQPCHDGATCIDNVGSFECVCEPPLEPDWMNGCQCPWGYVSDGVGGCLNIDDCANNPCGDEVTCVDYLGYYQCVCDWPMQWDGAESCVCPGGYQPDGLGGCEDIDECAGEPCNGGAVCYNYDGYYECACQWPLQPDGANGCVCSGGFISDESGGCVDIDECLDNVCGSLDCINYDGTYECLCNWPLQWDEGSNCICPEGFRWDEFGACVDINECAEGTHGCWEDETCYNEPGWYWCW